MTTAANSAHGSPAPPVPAGGRREAALDEQKRSFLRMASHELRTPLNSILGFSEILACELYGPLGDERYREYAGLIRESGEKLLKLVNQVLEIARFEAGDPDLDLRAEAVAPMVDELVESCQGEIAARGLRVRVEGLEEAVALGDARALRAVLSGLIANAVAFSPDGGEIRISAILRDGAVEIVVGNDGEGVQPSELERLLRPFEQGENALTRQGEGAGLGLAICDLACRAMGGRLKLASRKGEGFSAHVVLPRA